MRLGRIRASRKRLFLWAGAVVGIIVTVLLLMVNRFIEPILRDRLHVLIIQGSDSLYTYTLGDLRANFYGGNVEVENLQIRIDSNRYKELKARNALPSMTMQLDLKTGYIKGLSVLPLLFGKRIAIDEIGSKQADIRLSRHLQPEDSTKQKTAPLWKLMQPKVEKIVIDKIRLDGVKLLYRNADTSESLKLQFDRCDAAFDDIRIDSIATYDTTRFGFVKDLFLRFNDLKFRTPDSSYKMKAEWITYSSRGRMLEVEKFKLQPTREERDDFYGFYNAQKSMQVIEFSKARVTGLRLDQFIHRDIIQADSMVFDNPTVDVFVDRSMPPDFESKIGKYPHQRLLQSNSTIDLRVLLVNKAKINYTEKAAKTLKEATVEFRDISLLASNLTNKKSLIAQNPFCTARIWGNILATSPITVNFKFYLDSLNGRFDASGQIGAVNAGQLNRLSVPLANVVINSFNISKLDFQIRGEDFSATTDLRMIYNNLSVVINGVDDETGEIKKKKFLTKVINKFVVHSSNPVPGGAERIAYNVKVMRLTDKAFFGLIWKTVFAGMQKVMMQSGQL